MATQEQKDYLTNVSQSMPQGGYSIGQLQTIAQRSGIPLGGSMAPSSNPTSTPTVISNTDKTAKVFEMQNHPALTEPRGAVTSGDTTNAQNGDILNLPKTVQNTVHADDGSRDITYSDGTTEHVPAGSTPKGLSTGSEDEAFNAQLESMKASTDRNTADQISGIQQIMSQRKQQQQQINQANEAATKNALLMGGVTGQGSSAQYAPVSSQGIIQAQESYGVQQLATIDMEELGLINQAKQAGFAKNYALQEKVLDEIDRKRKEKADLVAELNKNMLAVNKKMQEEAYQAKKDNEIADIFAKGIQEPTKVLAELKARGVTATAEDVFNTMSKLRPEIQIMSLGGGKFVVIDKATGKVVNSYGGTTSTTPTSAVPTIKTDNGAQPVTGYKLKPGDDPYFIAKQFGTNMERLKQLNPQVTNWNNLPAGYVLNMPNNEEKWLEGKTQAEISAYNALDDGDKDIIKQLVNGDALLTDIVKSRGKDTTAQIKEIIKKATSVDPNFSINNNKITFAAKQKWNDPNGTQFKQRAAINTAIGHMATVNDASKKLKNADIPKYNDVANWVNKNLGNPEATNFVSAITALSGELAAAYKGGTPTDQETEKFYETLRSDMSRGQLSGALNQYSALLSGKLRSLAQEYKQTTGKYPTDPIVQADAIAELKRSGINTNQIDEILKKQGYDIPENTDPLNLGTQSGTAVNNDPLGLGI